MTSDAIQTQPALATAVRQATEADVDAIAHVVNHAYRVESFFVEGERVSPDDVRDLMRRGCFLVLDGEGGRPAATVYVQPGPERGYFGLLSVEPAFQGLGLGRRLVAVAEALCEAQGCRVMELQVVNLRTELPPWYRSLGYREHGTAPFPEGEGLKRPAHFILMSKPLA